ncbi:MAG: ABC-2 family transporter protein [Oscillospiraceae bacterium]|nr:ABC-2 family transporter protein [Oscillospiraceae bacterium]
MKKFFNIYFTCIKTAMARALAYRLNFVLSMLIALGWNALFPLVTILIYGAGASFPGWDFYEVLLIQSVFLLSTGFAFMAFNGVLWSTMHHIREGSFEIVLLKPISPIFFMIAANFDPECVGMIVGGTVLFTIAIVHTGVASVMAVGQFLILFTAGFAVMAGINMLMAATSFKWVGNSRIPEIFDSMMEFGKYPATIFPKPLQGIAAFVFPVSMIGFFPAQALLGDLEMYMIISIIPCILFMLFGIFMYKHMIKLYEGVGG